VNAKTAGASSYTFNIVIHGTVVILVDNQKSLEIMLPYDNCHCFIAACLDQQCLPIWRADLDRGVYAIRNVAAGESPKIPFNDPDRLVVEFPALGSNAWCKIVSLPWPQAIIAWRRFAPNILDNKGQTYIKNGLGKVDAKGIPTAYVVQYTNQTGPFPVLSEGMGSDFTVVATPDVARLHIFAESPTDTDHDAVATLNASGSPSFDLGINPGPSEDAPMAPPPDSSLAFNEQLALHESHVPCPKMPPCFSMKEQLKLELHSTKTDSQGRIMFRPRTCIPMIGVR